MAMAMIGGGIRCFGHLMKLTSPWVTNRLNRTVPRLSVKYLSGALGESKSKDSDDSESFGNIELPVEEKIVFNKFDLVEDDNDEQDAHDAKVGDIFRPGKDKFHRKLNWIETANTKIHRQSVLIHCHQLQLACIRNDIQFWNYLVCIVPLVNNRYNHRYLFLFQQ